MEFRLRLKEAEVKELREALIRHIQRLVEKRALTLESWNLVYALWYRFFRAGRVKGGAPAAFLHCHWETEEGMYRDIEEWLKRRLKELE